MEEKPFGLSPQGEAFGKEVNEIALQGIPPGIPGTPYRMLPFQGALAEDCPRGRTVRGVVSAFLSLHPAGYAPASDRRAFRQCTWCH